MTRGVPSWIDRRNQRETLTQSENNVDATQSQDPLQLLNIRVTCPAVKQSPDGVLSESDPRVSAYEFVGATEGKNEAFVFSPVYGLWGENRWWE